MFGFALSVQTDPILTPVQSDMVAFAPFPPDGVIIGRPSLAASEASVRSFD